jgi:hypothetical protein
VNAAICKLNLAVGTWLLRLEPDIRRHMFKDWYGRLTKHGAGLKKSSEFELKDAANIKWWRG